MADPVAASYAWCVATGGALSVAERATLLSRTMRAFAGFARQRIQLQRGSGAGRPTGSPDAWFPVAPDSELTRAALAACADQGPEMEGHGLRTWLFGAMLGARNRMVFDPELLHVAAIAHDVGLAQPVVGEDFTIRSARVAVEVFAGLGRPLDAEQVDVVRDGIVGHTTPGIDPAVNAMAVLLQAGATLDLTGLRLIDLPAEVVRAVYERHPQTGMRAALIRAIRAEAKAVPTGRFALLRAAGFPLAIRAAPHRQL